MLSFKRKAPHWKESLLPLLGVGALQAVWGWGGGQSTGALPLEPQGTSGWQAGPLATRSTWWGWQQNGIRCFRDVTGWQPFICAFIHSLIHPTNKLKMNFTGKDPLEYGIMGL